MAHHFFLLVLLLLQIGCTNRLAVQTRYLTHESLASSHVDTPDPNLHRPFIGQQLIISWYLPDEELAYENLQLNLKVRLRNREEKDITVPIPHVTQGYYIFKVVNEEFCETGGILTYKVEILGDSCVLECWKHPLWVELIKFDIK
ncbi:MAG: hypothetical protein H0W88_01155 [Parachlamydiaceae bacterium]|nr:hypothetical protein [Parachlamydiaceae bacterium]